MKVLSAFLDALSFLTIIPVPSFKGDGSPAQRMGRAVTWFPLVGGFIGWAGGIVVFLAASWWTLPVAALLGVGAMALLTGGLHLDGFADTVDGFGARGGREEILRVMRDSRIGTFGAIGLFLLLGLKWALIQSIPSDQWIPALVVSCALGRWAMAISSYTTPYVPGREGLGRLVTDQKSTGSMVRATILAVAILLAGTGHWSGLLVMGVAGLVGWALNSLFLIRLGGITGDTLGAVNEVVELSVLLFLVMR